MHSNKIVNHHLARMIEQIIADSAPKDAAKLKAISDLLIEDIAAVPPVAPHTTMSQWIQQALVDLKERTSHSKVIKSGFNNFDEFFGGFEMGELVVVGGRPSMGKTQWLVNLAQNMSKVCPVAFISYDLSALILTYRFISCATGIPIDRLLEGNLPGDESARLEALPQLFDTGNIFIADGPPKSLSALRAHCLSLVSDHQVKVIVIDYLQAIEYFTGSDDREEQIALFTRELKNIVRTFNVCLIVASQLNRSVEKRGGHRRPLLTDLRESGVIEQAADKVILLYRPEYYDILEDQDGNKTQHKLELIMAKNTNGPVGSVFLKRDEYFTRFVDQVNIS